MLNIDDRQPVARFALFNLGFRPFFLAASGFAIISMLLWMLFYVYGWKHQPYVLPAQLWHAHEMVYGYALAVIAGFLLTAIRNWTGQQTLHGLPLLGLLACWLMARVLPWFEIAIGVVAAFDLLFVAALVIATALPIIKVRQWHNLGIISKLLLLLAGNGLFYAGLMGFVEQGVRWGLYFGLYLVLALLFVMGRRVIPFFIEKGVGYPVQLSNRKWLDISSLLLFLLFSVVDVFTNYLVITSVLAGLLCALHALRLVGWYTRGIWQKPLIWILYLAYLLIVAGFALKAAAPWGLSPYFAVHAFAVGGIGLMTVGMMARVSLGHTGRSVDEPPGLLRWVFITLAIAAAIRVVVPMLVHTGYAWWIALSQVLWMLGFSLFLFAFLPMWWRPRVDGRPG